MLIPGPVTVMLCNELSSGENRPCRGEEYYCNGCPIKMPSPFFVNRIEVVHGIEISSVEISLDG